MRPGTAGKRVMIYYLLRRLIAILPIIIGVNVITFALFFVVNSPDDMARLQLGSKHVTPAAISRWKTNHGYDKPLFINASASGVHTVTDTLFFKKTLGLLTLQFGRSDQGRDIGQDIRQRMWPSLALAVPTLLLGLLVHIGVALLMVFFRRTYLDMGGVMVCVVLMSISGLFYIIGGQFLFAKMLRLVPISGYQPGLDALRFLLLPILIGVLSGLGAGSRWYRTLFLEEMSKDYVRTARAKGLTEGQVLRRHVLKNASIPILTGVVALLPLLFMGSLLMESFFGIPGLGSYTLDAINTQDFAIVRVMVFLGTVFYILGLLLTDLTYTWVDPRVRLG